MGTYDERPWLGLYDEGTPASIDREHPSGLAMFRAAARAHPDRPLLHYFSASRTVAQVDADSDGLAVGLGSSGAGRATASRSPSRTCRSA